MKHWVNLEDETDACMLDDVLQRVDEGMSTSADAEFLLELIEKLAAKSEKGSFGPKSAS